MPLDLNHLLNSAPVSPPHSQSHRLDQRHRGPSALELSNLLSPVAYQTNRPLPTESDDEDVESVHRPSRSVGPDLDQIIRSIPISPSTILQLQPPVFNDCFNSQSPRPNKQTYQQPIPMTSFSYDGEHQIRCGHQQFESIRPLLDQIDHTGFDLHHQISEAVLKDESIDEGLDGLLISLVDLLCRSDAQDRLSLYRGIRSTKLITWRGMLSKLCSSIYETGGTRKDQGWSMNVMMIDGTIYIEEDREDQSNHHPQQEPNQKGSLDEQTYFGYSYESLMTNHQFQPVNTNTQWVSVVKTNLNGTRIIIGGEVDCISPEAFQNLNHHPHHYLQHNINPNEFIEIKTSIAPTTDRDYWNFYRFKMLKFWLQSYLLGTPKIHTGLRDRQGILCGSQTYETKSIPSLVKQQAPPAARWSSNSCLDCGSKIIDFILNKFRSDLRQEGLADRHQDGYDVQTREYTHARNYPNRLKFFEDRLRSIVGDEFQHQKALRDHRGGGKGFDRHQERDSQDQYDLSSSCKDRLKELNQWPVYRLIFKPRAPKSSPTRTKIGIDSRDGINHHLNPASIELFELSYDQVLGSVINRKSNGWFGYQHPQFDPPPPSRVGFLPMFWIQTLVRYQVELLFEKEKDR